MIQLESFQGGRNEKHWKGYLYFVPSFINDQWKWEDQTLNRLLEHAAIRLGELNAYARLVPNIDFFIQLHVTKEAVVSSRIEGTQTNIDEALMEEEEINPERRNDWKKVNSYIRAMNEAIAELDTLPISSRLIRQTHKILLSNVRGKHKLPGQYRSRQNWIGGNTLMDAAFIPPHHAFVPELMSDLESFLHNDDQNLPALIKIGIAHYQFETIHPFLDGNGRIGRLLITLFLVEQKILQQPLLYLSAWFDKNKGLYYDNLTFVRTRNDMVQWLKYFLAGIAETAGEAIQTLSAILEMKNRIESSFVQTYGKRARNATVLLHALFRKPVIHVQHAQNILGVTYKTANDLVGSFVQHGLLKEITGQSRNRVFVFDEYLKLFQK